MLSGRHRAVIRQREGGRGRAETAGEPSGGRTAWPGTGACSITLEMFQLGLEDDPGLLMVMQVPADRESRDRIAALLNCP